MKDAMADNTGNGGAFILKIQTISLQPIDVAGLDVRPTSRFDHPSGKVCRNVAAIGQLWGEMAREEARSGPDLDDWAVRGLLQPSREA